MATITKEQSNSKTKELTSKPYILILENDDYNTFDHVINCLMSVCKHELEQATQCAYLVHLKGRCDVKYGDYETISNMKEKLTNSGLLVTMEENS